VQNVLDGTVEEARLAGLVERHAVDLVVATSGTVQRGPEPSNLDRFGHHHSFVVSDCEPSLIAAVTADR
jgi:hypothetical protein